MKNGEILRGPPLSRFMCSRSITSNPPMPDPMCTPVRVDNLFRDLQACGFHGLVRGRQGQVDEAAHLSSILFSRRNCRGSKFLTSAAIWQANCAASK